MDQGHSTTEGQHKEPAEPVSSPAAVAVESPVVSDDFVVPVAAGSGRRGKVPRYDGCSMRDWNSMLAQRTVSKAPLPRFGPAEIRRHAEVGDIWMVVHGVVYDCSSWIRFHPGGADTIMEAAGRDGTLLFDHYHRWVAADVMLAPFVVGIFDPRL